MHRHSKRAERIRFVFCLLAVAVIGSTAAFEAQSLAVEEARFVALGGIEQWITIRADRNNPVLLILHGGPGDTQSSLVSTYAPLEREFVVVQWDQREGGKTLAHGGALPISLELLATDGIELAQYVRR